MALDFTTGVLDPRVTFTRASTATFVGSNGIIQTAAINAPRFDYNPSTLAPLGLLIEEQRTNVALTSTFATLAGSAGSQYPSGTGWSNFFNTGGTRTYVASSVFAGSQAINIVGVTAARNLIGFSFAAASSTTYTVSFYVESVSGATGTIAYTSGALGVGGTTNLLAAPTTSGRYSYTFTTGTGAGTVDLRLGIGTAGNENGSIRISNYQVEVGAFATSYIPTVASQVTRNPDIVSMTGTNFSDWYNASEGTFAANFIRPQVASGGFPCVIGARQAAANDSQNTIEVYADTGSISTLVRTAGVAGQFSQYFGTAVGGLVKAVLAYKTSNFAVAYNGGAATDTLSGNLPTVDMLNIGYNTNLPTQFINGYIQSIRFWPQRLTSAEVQAFSK
jgi:hypothetical protein